MRTNLLPLILLILIFGCLVRISQTVWLCYGREISRCVSDMFL